MKFNEVKTTTFNEVKVKFTSEFIRFEVVI